MNELRSRRALAPNLTLAVGAGLMIFGFMSLTDDASAQQGEAYTGPQTSTSAPPPLNLSGSTSLRGVLAQADVMAYLQIFDLQEQGRLSEAAEIIATIESPVLMGYVEAQKYLHPTAHRSSFAELRDWLASYNDHPQADRIYRLARRRKPGDAAAPRLPVRYALPPVFGIEVLAESGAASRPGLTRDERRAVTSLKTQIASRIARGWPTGARELLRQNQVANLMSAGERIEIAQEIARGYYRAGKYAEGLAEAELAWTGGGEDAPLVHWWGGLAAWRLGRMDDAQAHFGALATAPDLSQWVLSAGAYWAARAYLAGRQPEKVNYWLNVGATYPYTFYGLLSRRALGYSLDYDWSLPALRPHLLARITASPNGQRAIALLQLGLTRQAEAELVNLAGNARDLATTVMALASRTDMPALAKRLSGADRSVTPPAAAMYPVPPWIPDGGFAVDRALIYAFIRQESGFNEEATSRAGARGLMQLMPSTASFITGDRSLLSSRKELLFDPGYNMHLGQAYIGSLLRHDAVANDLFKLAVGYNAGPGNLAAWYVQAGEPEDSLLFIESLPSRQTRIFVERVLANFWIYRDRLGQPTPSLSAAAAGSRPTLVTLDSATRPFASRPFASRGGLEANSVQP
ncbi:MAG: lytic transglycosylase domain-containing protein [Alphaproteobacteria bacterium]|nr:lytic transglycosylase domain-containing protein [Alphaproteobacteria bacterium]